MHQIGAVFYVLWGILHLIAAHQIYTLGLSLEPNMVQGRIFQHAWNLACIAIFVLVIALLYNWNNSPLGYWLNVIISSVTDIGFIFFILVPRHLPYKKGIIGPALWILAMVFSTIGISLAGVE